MREKILFSAFIILSSFSTFVTAFVPISNHDGPKGDDSQEEVRTSLSVGSSGLPIQSYSNYIYS